MAMLRIVWSLRGTHLSGVEGFGPNGGCCTPGGATLDISMNQACAMKPETSEDALWYPKQGRGAGGEHPREYSVRCIDECDPSTAAQSLDPPATLRRPRTDDEAAKLPAAMGATTGGMLLHLLLGGDPQKPLCGPPREVLQALAPGTESSTLQEARNKFKKLPLLLHAMGVSAQGHVEDVSKIAPAGFGEQGARGNPVAKALLRKDAGLFTVSSGVVEVRVEGTEGTPPPSPAFAWTPLPETAGGDPLTTADAIALAMFSREPGEGGEYLEALRTLHDGLPQDGKWSEGLKSRAAFVPCNAANPAATYGALGGGDLPLVGAAAKLAQCAAAAALLALAALQEARHFKAGRARVSEMLKGGRP